jgi:hypothetical protein
MTGFRKRQEHGFEMVHLEKQRAFASIENLRADQMVRIFRESSPN